MYLFFSSVLGFSLFLFFTQYHSARLRSLFFPDRYRGQVRNEPARRKEPLLYGVNVDISQILPTSQRYIANDEGDDLIDIATMLGINVLRITNNTKSFDTRQDGVYTEKEWGSVLNKMQAKNIKALVVIETASNNPNLYKEIIHADYLQQVRDYIIESNILFHPSLYGIDLKNEPIINDQNVKMIREAAHMIKTVKPDTPLTVGWWGAKTAKKDEDGNQIINWEDFAAGRKLDDFIDFYSLHIYGFDKQTFGLHSDPYTYTKRYISDVIKDLGTEKPILVGEFGAANGQAISDQETVGSPQLQANAYAGVYEALEDLNDPQVVGAVSYQFHSQSRDPDAWAIVKDDGNSLLPAAYVLQKFATGNSDISLPIPMDPVPKNYLFDNKDNNKTITLRRNDIVGFTLSLDPSYQYSADASDKSVLTPSQQLTYNEKFRRYHAVFHASDPGQTSIIVQKVTECREGLPCTASPQKVFSMRFVLEQ